jgi:hypothetical protein
LNVKWDKTHSFRRERKRESQQLARSTSTTGFITIIKSLTSLSLSLANVFKYAETTKELAGERCKRERVCVVFLSEQGLCFWASNRPTTYPTRDSLVACDEARG